eukprot:scaffold17550_cov119-Isochrysis_galbana.AAC.4
MVTEMGKGRERESDRTARDRQWSVESPLESRSPRRKLTGSLRKPCDDSSRVTPGPEPSVTMTRICT